jgi:hypothetical protein
MNHYPFGSAKMVGGLLPSDLLGRILAGDPEIPAVEPEAYGLQRVSRCGGRLPGPGTT